MVREGGVGGGKDEYHRSLQGIEIRGHPRRGEHLTVRLKFPSVSPHFQHPRIPVKMKTIVMGGFTCRTDFRLH